MLTLRKAFTQNNWAVPYMAWRGWIIPLATYGRGFVAIVYSRSLKHQETICNIESPCFKWLPKVKLLTDHPLTGSLQPRSLLTGSRPALAKGTCMMANLSQTSSDSVVSGPCEQPGTLSWSLICGDSLLKGKNGTEPFLAL